MSYSKEITVDHTSTQPCPKPAEFDFRSDSMTVPTEAILSAAMTATFKDDVVQEDPSTEALQAEMAKLTGHEAALFVISATMGNQLAMRSLLTQPPYSIIVGSRAHLLHWEAGGVSTLTGATMQSVEPTNGKYITLEDIKRNAMLQYLVQTSPTKVISIENTTNGLIVPLEEIRKISAFARQHNIKMHLDGARICEAVVAGAGTLTEFCQEFDAVTICFSKGLGAPIGSILIGSKDMIARARWIRQSLGGGIHQCGILAAMAHTAFKQTFGDSGDGKGSLLAQSHSNALQVADIWLRFGGKLLAPTETNMVFLDLEDARLPIPRLVKMASEHGLIMSSQRLVVHYQISEEAIRRVERLFAAIATEKHKVRDSMMENLIYKAKY